jgi:hypothetical protein
LISQVTTFAVVQEVQLFGRHSLKEEDEDEDVEDERMTSPLDELQLPKYGGLESLSAQRNCSADWRTLNPKYAGPDQVLKWSRKYLLVLEIE